MPFTILVLKAMGIQLVANFVGSMITSGMRPSINNFRRSFMRGLWALTGFVFIGALLWDAYKWMAS